MLQNGLHTQGHPAGTAGWQVAWHAPWCSLQPPSLFGTTHCMSPSPVGNPVLLTSATSHCQHRKKCQGPCIWSIFIYQVTRRHIPTYRCEDLKLYVFQDSAQHFTAGWEPQAVSYLPINVKAWVESKDSLCGICGEQSGTVIGFATSMSVLTCQYYTNTPYSFTPVPYFMSVHFTLFLILLANLHFLNLYSLIFCLISFGWLHYIMLTPYFWWKCHFLSMPFWSMPTF